MFFCEMDFSFKIWYKFGFMLGVGFVGCMILILVKLVLGFEIKEFDREFFFWLIFLRFEIFLKLFLLDNGNNF